MSGIPTKAYSTRNIWPPVVAGGFVPNPIVVTIVKAKTHAGPKLPGTVVWVVGRRKDGVDTKRGRDGWEKNGSKISRCVLHPGIWNVGHSYSALM